MSNLITYDSIEDAILGTVDQAVWTKQQYTMSISLSRRYLGFLTDFTQRELLEWHQKYGWSRAQIAAELHRVCARRIRELPDDILVSSVLGRSSRFSDEIEVYEAMFKALVI